MKIIDLKEVENISSFFRGKLGNWCAELLMGLTAIEKINEIYDRLSCFQGREFATKLLKDLGVNYLIGNSERLAIMPGGPFITISNHPYGGLDGVILIDLIGSIRPDYRIMVNRILSLVKTMKENFISVTPTGNKKKGITGTSINGIRETKMHLDEGHPMGFFPSGAVSDFSLKDMFIRDRKWQKSILHLIQSAKVPVLPIRFFDNNSAFFYFLGLIDWRIRSMRLPSELFNKRQKKTRVGIGRIITVEEQGHYADIESFGAYLRKAVYEMPLPNNFRPRNMINFIPEITEKKEVI